MNVVVHHRPTGGARRGSVYLAVLSIALVVSVIGVSALVGIRNEQAALRLTENAVQADFLAQSAFDLALRTLMENTSWRTTYTNNTWAALGVVGDAALAFKLVDEADGVLAGDPNQPVRLYARSALAGAIRIYSARVARSGSGNLVTNGGIESGTTGWTARYCTLTAQSSSSHSGNQNLQVRSRTYSYSGPYQDLTTALRNGATYNIEVWARMESGGTNMQIWLGVDGSGSSFTWFGGATTWVGTSWTQISTTITPTWTGSLTEAWLAIDTYASGSTGNFRIDDVVVVESNPDRRLAPVPGTWRREIRTGLAEAGEPIPAGALVAR
ncbi:MAG: carbohydrate binding domain-containing protein [Phycisphaerae bacterium]|nr:carbohydrate binding domain-containing protein [Phycisphaerae bacterium]